MPYGYFGIKRLGYDLFVKPHAILWQKYIVKYMRFKKHRYMYCEKKFIVLWKFFHNTMKKRNKKRATIEKLM